jgi:hypothetical protein
MLSGHTLADNLGVLVDEDVGLSAWNVDASLGEGDELRLVLGERLSSRLEGLS